MKASIYPHDKIYRDIMLQTPSFDDVMDQEWEAEAGLNGAQIKTASKLARGKWKIEIDDGGQATLIVE